MIVTALFRFDQQLQLMLIANGEICYAARRSPLRGKAGEPVSAPTGPDRTAVLIHYAIGD